MCPEIQNNGIGLVMSCAQSLGAKFKNEILTFVFCFDIGRKMVILMTIELLNNNFLI